MLETFLMIDKIFYVIIAAIGVPVNVLAIVILCQGKCGLSSCTTYYLVAMAMADLLLIIVEVILRQINREYFPLSFLDMTPVCSVVSALSCAATDCSVWFTVTFSFDRFVTICCRKLKAKYCTQKIAFIVLATTFILFCLKNVPNYFVYEPDEIFDNVPWFCSVKTSYYTEPGWVGFDWFDRVLTPLPPIVLILLFNMLTVRYIIVISRVRKALSGQSKGGNHSDPEMESRRKSMILLFTISSSFIILWLPYVFICFNFASNFDNDSFHVFEQVAYMLQNLSCCTNTFIYGATQSKFREQFKNILKYPITRLIGQ